MKRYAMLGLLLALALSGCAASHHAVFKPWQGLQDPEAEAAQKGKFKAEPKDVYEAVLKALERDPFLNWEFTEQDPAHGWLKASAGLFRILQVRVLPAEGGGSQVELSIPRRTLDGRAQAWKQGEAGYTAYTPGDTQGLQPLDVVFEEEEGYLYSLVYRQLHDQSAVPFDVSANEAVTLEK